jgi:hypothetical protein
MTATTLLKSWEVSPNSGLKEVILQFPNTTDENNTYAMTLSDFGISATGLLGIVSWVHTTDGSVIDDDVATTSVTAGVLTITLQSANANCTRVVKIIGRSDAGVFV